MVDDQLNPLLFFPQPVKASRHALGGGPSSFHNPSPARQVERLTPKFDALVQAFEAGRVELRNAPGGTEIEKVLVIEVAGEITSFFRTLKKLSGLEWLAEFETELDPDEDFYSSEEDRQSGVSGRFYLVMSNQQGLQQLLSLWQRFRQNPEAPEFEHGFKRFKALFQMHIKDIRPWGPEDRLRETGLKEDWEERVQAQQETVRLEIELWSREKTEERQRTENSVARLIEKSGGRLLHKCQIEEIAYHALLAELPIQEVKKIVNDKNAELILCDQVMYLRPVGQSVAPLPSGEIKEDNFISIPSIRPAGDPILALFDGMPLENHQLLEGRLRIDDPDGWASAYQANERFHGTAMASLIVHGELDAKSPPLRNPVYVRPILQPNPTDFVNRPKSEIIPENALPVDLIHQCVRRLFEQTDAGQPVAPSVRIINLSIGIPGKPFVDKFPSALARLIDFLSYKYQILFIVSAGNYSGPIELREVVDWASLNDEERKKIKAGLFRSLQENNRHRKILAPGEAINVLTVGALHDDASSDGSIHGSHFDPLPAGLMSPISGNGLGFKRAVKPEIFFPGGRHLYTRPPTSSSGVAMIEPVKSNEPPGQKVASPSNRTGVKNATRYTRGTSNATAIASRSAAQILEMLKELGDREGNRLQLDQADTSLLCKALLIHGADWGDFHKQYLEIFPAANRDAVTKFFGYGAANVNKIMGCPANRATLLGFGELGDGEGDCYQIPLPPSLSGQQARRRVTVTLAWHTPITSRHRAYRQAFLWFSGYDDRNDGDFGDRLRINRLCCDWQTVRRGTIQHEIFEGDSAVAFSTEDNLPFKINCKAEFGRLPKKIPYAVAVTIEVAEGINLPIYQEISEKVRLQTAARTRV